MKPPAASPGRAEKPQLPAPAPPGLARLLLSKSRRGGRSRRAPATSPMFVSRGRSRAAGADGEPSSPKVTCIGQVRMRKKKAAAVAPPKAAVGPGKAAKGYCRCLKKAFLCGGLFEFDRRRRRNGKAPPPPPAAPPSEAVERTRRSPWVFSSRDVAVAAAPKPADARSGRGAEDKDEDEMEVGVGMFGSVRRDEDATAEDERVLAGATRGGGREKKEDDEEEPEPQLVSSATTTPPKNALLLMRCRSAPQNRTSPLTSRFPVAAPPSMSPTADGDGGRPPASTEIAAAAAAYLSPSPSPRKPDIIRFSPVPSLSPSTPRKAGTCRFSPAPSPSPRRKHPENGGKDDDCERRRGQFALEFELPEQATEEAVEGGDEEEADEYDDDEYDDEEMRCSSARPLVLQRCKSEPATTAAAKMAGGPAATTAGCFWANGGSSGRRRHATPPPHAAARPVGVALTGH